MHWPFTHRFVSLGGILLGVALVCLFAMTPLPPLMHFPPFPGGAPVALTGGILCLPGGVLCLFLGWRYERIHAHRAPEQASGPVTEQPAVLDEILEQVPDLPAREELEHLPHWLLRVLHAHRAAGRLATARHLLAEWEVSPLIPSHSQDLSVCQVCGIAEQSSQFQRCTHCQQMVHPHCSVQARQAYADGATLEIGDRCLCLCQNCLDMLQTQGWQLEPDGEGRVLLWRRAFPHDHA